MRADGIEISIKFLQEITNYKVMLFLGAELIEVCQLS